MNKKHKIKGIEIALGITFIILGILSLNRPLLTLKTLVLWFGITSAESTYKSVRVEFVHQYQFETLTHLRLELFDYVHWWNNLRLHGTLGYETPNAFRDQRLAKRTLDNELGCDTTGEAA